MCRGQFHQWLLVSLYWQPEETRWGQGSFVFDSCLCDWLKIQKSWAWTFSKVFGHILTHRKYVIPPKLQAFNYREVSLLPSSNMDLQSGRLCLCCFPHAYLLYHCISVQHSQLPCEDCESAHRVLEDTDAILLRATAVLLSSVCLCSLFF